MTKISGDGVRVGRLGANRVELTEDGFAQYTDGGVAGIMAGLSATNHTVDAVTNPGTIRFGDVFYYKVTQHDDVYSRNTVHVEYPFILAGGSIVYPTSGVDKLLFRVERRAVVSGVSSLSTSYEVAVPFDTSYSWQMPNTSYYLQWIVGSQGKGLQLIKETADPYGASHTEMRVYCNGYATEEQLRSPVLLFGEHSDMGAPGLYAVALGQGSSSEGDNAFTAGIATNAASEAQTAIGKYNANDSDNAFEVGNGTADDARSNAATIDWSGNYLGQAMAGIIQMFAGATPPNGWLVCDGSAVSRTTYATLFAAIGTTWGTGDGSTTFNLPDLRGRAPIGAGTGSGLTERTLGTQNIGSENVQAHTHSISRTTNVAVSDSGHTHPAATSDYYYALGSATFAKQSGTAQSGSSGLTNAVRQSGTVSSNKNTGSGKASLSVTQPVFSVGAVSGATTGTAGNMQPSAVVNFIICTGKTS